MEGHLGILNKCYYMKEAILEKLGPVWIQLCNILEKVY